MSPFTEAEFAFLTEDPPLARFASVGADGTPHVVPVGWSLDPDSGVVTVTGLNLPATKKFRDVARHPRAALVVDDVLPPWQPRGVEIRGRAETVEEPEPAIHLFPGRIIGWGLDDTRIGHHHARSLDTGAGPGRVTGFRYLVDDVARAMAFYRDRLGFVVERDASPGFAMLARDLVRLFLNSPGSGGAGEATPDGRTPEPGGWNRLQIQVGDLDAEVRRLRKAGVAMRTDVITGRGGRQVLVEDPAANPVELFEPAAAARPEGAS